ncbi:MAG: hypothetical protein AAFR38_01355 [Planctomycetota bacterium]
MTTRPATVAAVAAFSTVVAPAAADVIGGDATIVAPFANVGNNNQQMNVLYAFNEQRGVTLTMDLAVDGGVIAAGTVVDSHYIVYDPVNNSVVGDVIFDDDILGVISETSILAASDFLGAPSTNYLNPGLRGLESGDSYMVNGDTITVRFSASTPGDYVRVITLSKIPTPGAAATLALGGLVAARRRR